ncbi:DUF5966 family protein [Streptococcus ictaluri]|uniref:Uncharacterized protein n=1 Tax=Streptococcus ictaluri 707-05 TaxID=764299 RepID=G5K339_9STRE|nr:DUF5966 family protein [Streptococcus ictaluri]EHI69579.1 hypothetical protein STRIC_1207 [Streptococcus ictaluri 707-05]
MQELMEQVLQGLFLMVALGAIFIILYKLLRVTAGLFLIGVIGGLAFVEIYGIYLFFTERYLYSKDLVANGIWSFSGFFIVFNCFILFVSISKIVKNRIV